MLRASSGFSFVAQSGERCWLAELHRLSGHVARAYENPYWRHAETCFVEAINVARHQDARLLELRAATDLARLWRDTGSNRDPRPLLEPALAGVEGGESTLDVRHMNRCYSPRTAPHSPHQWCAAAWDLCYDCRADGQRWTTTGNGDSIAANS
jgi:hypothetical protein